MIFTPHPSGFDNCVICRRRITDTGWEPFCCEVCFDSGYAADRELAERYFEGESDSD